MGERLLTNLPHTFPVIFQEMPVDADKILLAGAHLHQAVADQYAPR